MQKIAHSWDRTEAELHIGTLFDAARSGFTQTVKDKEGVFEVTFKASPNEPVGRVLSRGGPFAR
ncbi:hypothetical protein [Shinella sp.]|uniref:hypothetical protein n=1 Tax=Shinella sp. TaxID=1870904 RepID=UPI0028A8184A|nr:hypothetical protein [Shinella sp.]